MENFLSDDYLSLLKKSGCRELIFGLESASQRILDLMNKQNLHETDFEILKGCHENGIAVNLQTFIGFPTETKEEAKETIQFLFENEKYIHSIGFGKFMLFDSTPVFLNPKKFGIENITKSPHDFTYKFKRTSGMSEDVIETLHQETLKEIDNIFRNRVQYLSAISGAHTLLHLSHYDYARYREFEMQNQKQLPKNLDFHTFYPKKNEDFLIKMLDSDEGSRYLGEFAIGTNYGIKKFTKSILFDEKIGGSFHMALGAGYPETGSVNKSSIHWDMICDIREDSEIRVDGELLYKDGKFQI